MKMSDWINDYEKEKFEKFKKIYMLNMARL